MAHELEGLPSIYRERAEQEAVASAPAIARRNREKIDELQLRIEKLENRVRYLEAITTNL